MIMRVELLLLSFGVGVSGVKKFQDFGEESFGVTENIANTFDPTTTIEPQLTQEPMENVTIQNKDSNKFFERGIPHQNSQGISNKTIKELLRKASTCRERYFKVLNNTIIPKQRAGSTHRIRAGLGRNSNVSVFHCNISKELVDGLKDKLHQLEIFQDIIVLYPKSRSSNIDHLSAPKTQAEIKKYHKNFLSKKDNKNLTGRRRERDMLLKNDQIESDTKVQQISHIYLGRSLYPLFTEESRIISKDHTLPPPVYTERTYLYHDNEWAPPEAQNRKRKIK